MSTQAPAAPAVTPSSDAFNFKSPMVQPKGGPSDLLAKMAKKTGQEFTPDAPKPIPQKSEKVAEVPDTKDAPVTEIPPAEPKPKTGFVKNLVDSKKTLEQRNAELEAKVREYEEAKVPELSNKVQELETKLNEATSAGEVAKLSKQLEAARAERDEQVTKLSEESKTYRDRLDFYEIQDNPLFKEKFVAPLTLSYDVVTKTLAGNKSQVTELNKAIAFHTAALRATDPEEQSRQITLRDDVLNGISEGLQPVQQSRFNNAVWDLVDKFTTHDEALRNHQATVAQIKEEQSRLAQETGLQTRNRWNSAMKSASEKVTHSFPEEIQRVIAANKIEADSGIDSVIASSFVENGAADYSPEEVCRLVQQGTQYKPLKGHIAAQEALISELQETINKLKGGGTGGGTRSGSESSPQVQQPAKKTPDQLFGRMAAKLGGQ